MASLTAPAMLVIVLVIIMWMKRRKAKNLARLDAKAAEDRAEVFVEDADSDKKVTVVYSTQTGSAEDFAKRFAKELRLLRFTPRLVDIEDYEHLSLLEDERFVVMFAATYGEGEPTDTGIPFWNYLIDEDREGDLSLKNMNFLVFGLGNSTYDHYNVIGEKIDQRFEELGGTRLSPLGMSDDFGSKEDDFNEWRENAITDVCAHFGLSLEERVDADLERDYSVEFDDTPGIPSHPEQKPSFAIDAARPYQAGIVAAENLHSEESDRLCYHLELDLSGSGIKYEAGDHIGVVARNSPKVVGSLVSRIGGCDRPLTLTATDPSVAEEKKTPFPSPITAREAFSRYVDITCPCPKRALKVLALYTSDATTKAELESLTARTTEAKAKYQEYIVNGGRSIVDVLTSFGDITPDVPHLLECLPRLQPRYYSISSSPRVNSDLVSITFVTVEYINGEDREVAGVATSFLREACEAFSAGSEGATVPIFHRRSSFRPPRLLSSPMIMVGPGTGIAPFRGFLADREAHRDHIQAEKGVTKALGDVHVFFGCRSSSVDFLYSQQLKNWASPDSGVISKLHLAFSREDPAKKVYVQQRITEASAEVGAILANGGSVYVCGDGQGMAKGVHAALVEVLVKEGISADHTAAEEFISKMQEKRCYQSDVW